MLVVPAPSVEAFIPLLCWCLAHLGMAPDDVDRLAATLDALRDEWLILPIHDELIQRAARRFPVEPVRSLDAIHLASAQLLSELHGQTILFVALDGRVRVNAVALGVEVAPPG